MKKSYNIYGFTGKVKRDFTFVPLRYVVALFLMAFGAGLIIGTVVFLTLKVPYFWIVAVLMDILCLLMIVNSTDSPEYKVPWMLVVLGLPVIGYMMYFIFYGRKLSRKMRTRIAAVNNKKIHNQDAKILQNLKKEDEHQYQVFKLLKSIANTSVYQNVDAKYYDLGEKFYADMLEDLKKAEDYIFMEFFIVSDGVFLKNVMKILQEKVKAGVEVKFIYDDIGCIGTLPGDYYKQLRRAGIDCVLFNKLKGDVSGQANNRSHRKLIIIDGKVGYTGGINLADEYINKKKRFGHWKDGGVRLAGAVVTELVNIFAEDYYINTSVQCKSLKNYEAENQTETVQPGFVVPYGDGPRIVYPRGVSKLMLLDMFNTATDYVYVTTPYLVCDSEIRNAIINAALRGVDVHILTPHIPDKKLVFLVTRSYYKILLDAGVRIFEYKPGFLHAKTYVSDDKKSIIGTINLDYRSLEHHFENGVYFYNHPIIKDVKTDIESTIEKCIEVHPEDIKANFVRDLVRSIVFIFSSML